MSLSKHKVAAAARERFLVEQARPWGIKVHRKFKSVEVRLIFPCSGMQSAQDLETITPQGILLAKQRLPRWRTCALATLPFAQQIPISQARRYLSRDAGCPVLSDKGDGFASLVQAHVVDLNDRWYRECQRYTVDNVDDLTAALQRAMGGAVLQTASVEPEAVHQLRILARTMFGKVADEQTMIMCARQYENPELVFVGRAEDIHLFLRNESVRKELGVADWTQRGYTARDRSSSFFNFSSQNMEVELGAWDEEIAMYQDADARTLATVQPLCQFKKEKQLGEEVLDTD